MFSDAYVECLAVGPFPNRVDPWAEEDHYFQQIHAGILDHILSEIQPMLRRLGYRAGREASLQILGGREPDVFVQRVINTKLPSFQWDYALAAEEILVEPGDVVLDVVPLQAIHIHETASGDLVTIVELISPGNKNTAAKIAAYQQYRENLIVYKGVNLMEIDITRSSKRLMSTPLVQAFPYHVAVYLPGQSPRFIGMDFDQPLKRLALPLRGQVVPFDLQAAYTHGYRNSGIADQLLAENQYVSAKLQFASLLTEDQKQACMAQVTTWQAQLAALRPA
jgi:hypothetical protein